VNTRTPKIDVLESSARVCPEEANPEKKSLATADLLREYSASPNSGTSFDCCKNIKNSQAAL
jgi:hypothetical protein